MKTHKDIKKKLKNYQAAKQEILDRLNSEGYKYSVLYYKDLDILKIAESKIAELELVLS